MTQDEMEEFAKFQIRRTYALSLGYFWLPCSRCGDYFGGNEEHGDPAYNVRTNVNLSSIVCKKHKLPPRTYFSMKVDQRVNVVYNYEGEIVEVIPWDVK